MFDELNEIQTAFNEKTITNNKQEKTVQTATNGNLPCCQLRRHVQEVHAHQQKENYMVPNR